MESTEESLRTGHCDALGSSPPPSGCSDAPCAINIGFSGDAAHALVTYLGSESFVMTVTCGQFVSTQTVRGPSTGVCGL